jgi:FHS family L-fucose permease-like MFS transporter
MKTNFKVLALLCLVFLAVGSMFCMNDILLPTLITHFSLSYTESTLIQLSFYLTYILFPFPIAWVIHRYGYKNGLLLALFASFLGCLLFVPAYMFNSFIIVLIAIFTLSTGITILNVAANPFITLLGNPEGAHRRMNFVQVFSRLGYALTPIFATTIIYNNTGDIKFHFPYLLIGLLLLMMALLTIFVKMPSFKAEKDDVFSVSALLKESIQYKHLLFGVIAMFFYVGAEASTAGFFIPYLRSHLNFSDAQAATFLTLYYVLATGMGFICVMILKVVKANKLVGFFGLGLISVFLICILANTGYNEYVLASLGLFLPIMFPTIFSLALSGLGGFAAKGSAMLNYAIVGGAFFPMIQGMLADNFGVQTSYVVPLVCYVYITIYAFFLSKPKLSSINSGVVEGVEKNG